MWKPCSKQKIKKDSQHFIMKKTGYREPFKTTLQSQTLEYANQLTWKQERKLLNRLLGREQVWLWCGPKQQGNGLGSPSQTQNWRCWCLPACCCGPHLQCPRCSPHVGSKLAHEFCSSGVELLPVRQTGNKKGGSIFMSSIGTPGVSVHKQLAVIFFLPPLLWSFCDICLHWWCVHTPCVAFNSIMSKPGRAHYALPENPCSTDVGFISIKIINRFVYMKSYLKYIETGGEFQHLQTA